MCFPISIRKVAFYCCLCAFPTVFSVAQTQAIADGQTLEMNGFEVSFQVVNQRDIDVQKVTHDRYEVVARVANKTGKGYNIRNSTYPDPNNVVGPVVAQFICRNATGARMTSKKAEVRMATHQLQATYYARNSEGKNVQQKMLVTAGFFVDPDMVLEEKAIFIVPQGEELDVQVSMNAP